MNIASIAVRPTDQESGLVCPTTLFGRPWPDINFLSKQAHILPLHYSMHNPSPYPHHAMINPAKKRYIRCIDYVKYKTTIICPLSNKLFLQ